MGDLIAAFWYLKGAYKNMRINFLVGPVEIKQWLMVLSSKRVD